MSIYVDEIRQYASGKWCHMWADSDAELDTFAASIGLKPEWSHTSKGVSGRFYHYDLRPSKRVEALAAGAVFMPLKDYIKGRMILQQHPTKVEQVESVIEKQQLFIASLPEVARNELLYGKWIPPEDNK